MKVVKIELSITDILLIKTGLDHVINNNNYHECDREVAKQLYKYIDEETTKQVLESVREDISHVTPRAHIRTGKLSIENTLMIPMDKVLEIVDKYMDGAKGGKGQS